jgi:hypothetical protein
MLERTSKLLIGKDINRDADVVAGVSIVTTIGSTGLADGEVVVLDKNFKVLAEGATVADSDVIYVCQGTGDTTTYATEAAKGTPVTARKILLSDPIHGKFVKNWKGKAYSAPSQQSTAIDFTGVTVVKGTEYVLRIVYKDVHENPNQFTQTYRIIAAGTTLATDLIDKLDEKVNAHSGRRVNATNTDTVLTLTGKAIAASTTSLKDIDKYSMVEFDAFVSYIDSDGNWADLNVTSNINTVASYGSGSWYQVRDLEKAYLGWTGPTNRTLFPVIEPDMRTVKNSTYNLFVIEHERPYTSPDNQYVKYAPLSTVIAMVVPSGGTQQTNVLAQLNPWMASCPGAFSNVGV